MIQQANAPYRSQTIQVPRKRFSASKCSVASGRRFAGLGDVIVCSVKSVIPGSEVKKKVDRTSRHRPRAKAPTRRAGWQLYPI